MKIERRILSAANIRGREDRKGIQGYAAVFNSESENLGWFIETIAPGAFTRTLSEKADVRCLFNHDDNLILGRTKSGTLLLSQDERGLQYDCTLPDTQMARDIYAAIERGDIDQSSFGFYVREQKWTEKVEEDGTVTYQRQIMDVDLLDVAPVTFPAYPATQVEARALWPEGVPEEISKAIERKPMIVVPDYTESAQALIRVAQAF